MAPASCAGSVQVPAAVPLVQPAPPTSPLALSQPPAYQAQDAPASDSSSPMFFADLVSSTSGSWAPFPNGRYVGWMVFTAYSPQARAGLAVGPQAWVSSASLTGPVGV